MRYYVTVDSRPESKTYREPRGLFRWGEDEEAGTLSLERFDRKEQKWVDHPNLLAATGIGGDNDFEPISAKKARELLEEWGYDSDRVIGLDKALRPAQDADRG
jgi:hypothetical protein